MPSTDSRKKIQDAIVKAKPFHHDPNIAEKKEAFIRQCYNNSTDTNYHSKNVNKDDSPKNPKQFIAAYCKAQGITFEQYQQMIQNQKIETKKTFTDQSNVDVKILTPDPAKPTPGYIHAAYPKFFTTPTDDAVKNHLDNMFKNMFAGIDKAKDVPIIVLPNAFYKGLTPEQKAKYDKMIIDAIIRQANRAEIPLSHIVVISNPERSQSRDYLMSKTLTSGNDFRGQPYDMNSIAEELEKEGFRGMRFTAAEHPHNISNGVYKETPHKGPATEENICRKDPLRAYCFSPTFAAAAKDLAKDKKEFNKYIAKAPTLISPDVATPPASAASTPVAPSPTSTTVKDEGILPTDKLLSNSDPSLDLIRNAFYFKDPETCKQPDPKGKEIFDNAKCYERPATTVEPKKTIISFQNNAECFEGIERMRKAGMKVNIMSADLQKAYDEYCAEKAGKATPTSPILSHGGDADSKSRLDPHSLSEKTTPPKPALSSAAVGGEGPESEAKKKSKWTAFTSASKGATTDKSI